MAAEKMKSEEKELVPTVPSENVTAILSPSSIGKGLSKLRSCCVPFCNTNSNNSPDKLFITVPKDAQRKLDWFDAMKLEIADFPRGATLYCCENHFVGEQDFMDWYFLKMKYSSTAKIKRNVVPHVFEHYDDWHEIMPPQLKPCQLVTQGTASSKFCSVSDEHLSAAACFENVFTAVDAGIATSDNFKHDIENKKSSPTTLVAGNKRPHSMLDTQVHTLLKTCNKKKICNKKRVLLGKHYSEYRVQRIYELCSDQKVKAQLKISKEMIEICEHSQQESKENNVECEDNCKSTQYKFMPEQRSVSTNVSISSIKHVATETSNMKRKEASTNTLHISDEEIQAILSKRVKGSGFKSYFEGSNSEQSGPEADDGDWEISMNVSESESDDTISNDDDDDDSKFLAMCLSITRKLHDRSWQHYLGLPADCYWVIDSLAEQLNERNRSVRLSNRAIVEFVLRRLTLREKLSILADCFGFRSTKTLVRIFSTHSQFIIDSLESIGVLI